MIVAVNAICAAAAVPFRGEEKSAIAKQPLSGKVRITTLGLAGDEQADLVHHGGPDMAVHHYPRDHHDYWRSELGDHPLLAEPGAFGSNLFTIGITEEDVLLGDRFRLGSALLEACQPRQPCWKIEHRFGEKAMVKRILRTGRCGWFYRVIEEGEAEAGDRLEKVADGLAGWSMARIFNAIWGTTHKSDPELLKEIAELPLLAEKLRAKLVVRTTS
ncbi:MOSC domain-containing protein [Alteraurantiacibacter aquimixticola]|uniref:MOSC domain-containing protein n=1 Tax=Alteraurantiacibacter aquimixticola TaxID=2489173 RepID=A0A4T3F022_9SPHN|nr:MOSC domain-containing protein [Alteraurantiacibacter aquimixticola]TIX50369.1 MOSC domain-containing protein [Alteraurantiacibacter aquimixticola]